MISRKQESMDDKKIMQSNYLIEEIYLLEIFSNTGNCLTLVTNNQVRVISITHLGSIFFCILNYADEITNIFVYHEGDGADS